MKIILAIFIAVISLVTQPENTHAQELTVKSIQDDLKVKSPRKVVSSLYNDREKWNILLRNIVSGDIEWLKIAVSLHKGSDAHASESLCLATGEALEHNPENVFKLTLDGFRIYEICSGIDVDDIRYDLYELSIEGINKRIKKVSAIKDKNLQDKCNECLRYLSEDKKHVARFYQVDKTSP